MPPEQKDIEDRVLAHFSPGKSPTGCLRGIPGKKNRLRFFFLPPSLAVSVDLWARVFWEVGVGWQRGLPKRGDREVSFAPCFSLSPFTVVLFLLYLSLM